MTECAHREYKDFGYMRRCVDCGHVISPTFDPDSTFFHPENFVPNHERLAS